ncbi:hypothetical protein F5Y09DRAFT_231797 [Xylaria sp. FL1042]|nr:hypothetical protein F5Y09DRAFT_231797 [Xylaria sp. FL1042]
MSEDVSRFLSQVKELGERRIEEDEARSRELEEKILQDRKERQARRRGEAPLSLSLSFSLSVSLSAHINTRHVIIILWDYPSIPFHAHCWELPTARLPILLLATFRSMIPHRIYSIPSNLNY